jgi:uncharacterized protein YycO
METSNLQTCDILLYKGSGFTARLIQWGSSSVYSHVAVIVDAGMHLAVESNTGHQSGVRALDLRKLDEKIVDVYRVKNGFEYDADKVISHLVSRLGAKYDWAGVIGLGLMKLASAITGFTLLRGYNEFQKKRDYFCSELVYEAFAEGGLDIVPQVDSADITSPGDIARSPIIESVTKKEYASTSN